MEMRKLTLVKKLYLTFRYFFFQFECLQKKIIKNAKQLDKDAVTILLHELFKY